jgi:carbamoyltransferase
MLTLGINAAFHDSSACMVRDGHILAAAEEERFTGFKHGKRPIPFSAYELPYHAIDYCLEVAGIGIESIDHIAYAFDPRLLKDVRSGDEITLPLEPSSRGQPPSANPWDGLFLSHILNAPRHLRDGYPHHLQERFLHGRDAHYTWHWVDHHLSHAASAFLPSPFEEAAVIVIDGRGEQATTSYWRGHQTQLDRISDVRMPNSLGLLYEQVTEHLGFLRSSDEYKVMALASYGKPTFAGPLRNAIHIDGGSYSIDPIEFTELCGPRRQRGAELEQWHYDLARSVQVVLEETVLALCGWLRATSGSANLCMAGGVALNCVMNAKVRDSGLFSEIWIQPAAGDSGTALGAAMWVDARESQASNRPSRMTNVYLGPEASAIEIENLLTSAGVPYSQPKDLVDHVTDLLAEGNVIGWFQGRMEFGPRALGARSILASPTDPDMQRRLNLIKDREDFRPVAPVVPEEYAADWFSPASQSPFMLFVHDVVRERRDQIPAVMHFDGTARIQTVNRSENPLYYSLLCRFGERTGVPVLVNTSFNTRSKPIVCAPADALACFIASPIDVLVMGPYVLEKKTVVHARNRRDLTIKTERLPQLDANAMKDDEVDIFNLLDTPGRDTDASVRDQRQPAARRA